MEQTLYGLIELQEVDNRLDELKDARGDLPLIVEELEYKLSNKKEELKNLKEELKAAKVKNNEMELAIEEARERLEKYDEQLYQVKTNKEYDAITTESEHARQKMEESKNERDNIQYTIEEIEERITELESETDKLEGELEENKSELKVKLEGTAEEENLLKQERSIIVEKTNPSIVSTYERVRDARGGQGIAKINGNVCGGCFSYIPPQKVVEVKKMKQIFTCESCGRILVWDDSEV
ncbi:MAG: hypothetical protein GF313_04445 [Caldithrix sp.]|nr:hypothetical protein [Caldithrix sp.]